MGEYDVYMNAYIYTVKGWAILKLLLAWLQKNDPCILMKIALAKWGHPGEACNDYITHRSSYCEGEITLYA